MWDRIEKIKLGDNALIEHQDDSIFVTANVADTEHGKPTKRIRLLKKN